MCTDRQTVCNSCRVFVVVYIRLPMIRHGQGKSNNTGTWLNLDALQLFMMTDITSSLLNMVYITRKLLLLIDVLALCKEN